MTLNAPKVKYIHKPLYIAICKHLSLLVYTYATQLIYILQFQCLPLVLVKAIIQILNFAIPYKAVTTLLRFIRWIDQHGRGKGWLLKIPIELPPIIKCMEGIASFAVNCMRSKFAT